MSTPDAADRDWHAGDYGRNARFVANMAVDLIDWLDPQPEERVLDLGCGDGALSERIAARGAIVVGVDASPAMVAAACERGLDAYTIDGQALTDATLGAGFDAVFSNAALHWMSRDPDRVIAGVRARLAPGGRFVAEFGGDGNIAPIHAALRVEAAARDIDPDSLDPWYFPTEADYRARLEAHGFRVERMARFARPTPLPGDVADWLTTLARPFVTAFAPGPARDAYVAAVRARLEPTLADAEGAWHAPYVRLRFAARAE